MKTILFFSVFAIYATLSTDAMNWSMWLRGLACGVMLSYWAVYGKIYRLEKIRPYSKIVDLSNFMYNKNKHEYFFEPENLVENHATEELIKFLVSNGYLRYTVR